MENIHFGIDYKEVYIDFETCFENLEKINTFVMMYLYQCVNKNIKINLLTQNKENVFKFLKSNKIDILLFNDLIEIERKDIKDILKENSILLSNDDKLKNEIRKDKKNYYCFSNNIIESLIDWRA